MTDDLLAAATTAAECDGELIRFVSVGPSRDDVEPAEELWALYVRAAWWGRGVGRDLLAVTLGDRPAYLWVLDGNERAAAFYRKHGFVDDGVTRTDNLGVECRMVRTREADDASDVSLHHEPPHPDHARG